MNMSVQNLTAAQIISEGAARRARLMNPPNKYVKPALPAPSAPVVRNIAAIPEWKKRKTLFNRHVDEYRAYLFKLKTNPIKAFVKRRAAELGLTVDQLTRVKSAREVSGMRHYVFWQIREIFGASYPRIAREFNIKDHTTIMHGIHRVRTIRPPHPTEEYLATEKDVLTNPAKKAAIIARYFSGDTPAEIAELFECDALAIRDISKIENWRKPSGAKNQKMIVPPARVNMSKLKSDWENFALRVDQMEAEYGISYRQIRRIAEQQGWKRSKAAYGNVCKRIIETKARKAASLPEWDQCS